MLQMNSWSGAWEVLMVVFGGGLVVAKLSERPRIPDVAAFLVYGVLIGPTVLHWVSVPSQSQVSQFLMNMGAVLILFDGGRSVALAVLKKVWVSVTMLSTVGVFVTVLVVGLAAHWLFHSTWLFALLLGSVIASTDPATLIPVFKRVAVIPNLSQTVESESAFNDAVASVLTFTLMASAGVAAAGTGHIAWGHAAWQFVWSAAGGLAVGLALGLLCLWLLSPRAWGVFHEFGSVVMLVTAISAYQVAALLHASGFMAAFAAGVIAGNGSTVRWPLAPRTENNAHHFGNALTLILRMTIFVLLGTQVNFGLVGQYVWVSLGVVAILMLVARPITVLSSVLVDRNATWRKRDVLFMCWVRETGVIPAALAGTLVAHKIPGAPIISAVTFMAILLTIVIQASTTDAVAKRLGVTAGDAIEEEV